MAETDVYFMCFCISGEETFHQWNIVRSKSQVDKLEKIDVSEEGGCCGQTRCLACVLDGITIAHVETHRLSKADYLKNQKLYDAIDKTAYFKIDELIEKMDNPKVKEDDEEEDDGEDEDETEKRPTKRQKKRSDSDSDANSDSE